MRNSTLTLACMAIAAAFAGRAANAADATRGVDPTKWGSIEYLNLWTPGPPLPFPLVTTGDAAGAGHLGASSTRVLLGSGPMSIGSFPAGRVTAGAWFDDDENFGGEFTAFFTGLRAAHFQAAGNASGGPLLAIPFVDVSGTAPQESSLVISQPGVRSGRISADDANIFGGLDLHGLINLSDFLPNDHNRLALLAGLRTLFFKERFQFDSVTTDMSGLTLGHNDIFMDQDNFFGGDLGLRGSRRFQRFSVELTGKAAIGVTTQTQYVTSQGSLPFFPARMDFAARDGLFTQPTNISYTFPHRTFSVVPAARLRLGYDLTDHIRLTVSYEAFLWTRMMRPSGQLDRELNLSQTFGPLAGAARPTLQSSHTDFWAQGFTAGLQFNY